MSVHPATRIVLIYLAIALPSVLVGAAVVHALSDTIAERDRYSLVAAGGFVLLTSVTLYVLIRKYLAELMLVRDEAVANERLFRALATSLDDLVFTFDRDLRITSIMGPAVTPNAAQYEMNLTAVGMFGEDLELGYAAIARRVLAGESLSADWFQEVSPRTLPVEGHVTSLRFGLVPLREASGEIIGGIGIGRDMSQVQDLERERETARRRISFLVHYDELTGLPNRTLMEARLQEAIILAARRHQMVAVHYLDLNEFKNVNDTLGHPAGDRMLQEVASRLRAIVPRSDTVARMSGDEFMVIQSGITAREQAAALASRIGTVFALPFHISGQDLFGAASAGIALYPEHGLEATDLYRAADTAMYAAKEDRTTPWAFFDPEMAAEARERLALLNDLQHAVEREEITVAYQPILRSADATVVAFEALARWDHAVRGNVSPGVFIPLAEGSGLVHAIDGQVRRQAFAWLRESLDQGFRDIRIHVNISASLLRVAPVRVLQEEVAAAGITADLVILEVTETELVDPSGSAKRAMEDLQAAGFVLTVDDFGTGYSSLNYLRRLPVAEIKIDASFLGDLSDDRTLAVIESTVGLARRLGYRVVQEGVETPEQREYVRACGIEEWQGFLASRPVTGEVALAYLAGGLPSPAV